MLLRERGLHIRNGDGEKIIEVGKKMQECIKKDFDYIKKPASAYITFKRVKGSQSAKKLLCKKDKDGNYPQLFGDRIKCERADNPSDIHWENKEVTYGQLFVRNTIFSMVVLAVLCFTYVVMFFPLLQKNQAEVDILPTVDQCDSMGK